MTKPKKLTPEEIDQRTKLTPEELALVVQEEERLANRSKEEEERDDRVQKYKKPSNLEQAKKQKDADQVNVAKIFIEIKKLKIAKKLAFTRKAKIKLIDKSEDLIDDIESKIKSVALNRFTIRKVKNWRLKNLGGSRDEINDIIDDITSSNDNILDKAKDAKLGFGIDRKFVKLTASEVLDKIGYKSKKDKAKNKAKEAGVLGLPSDGMTPEELAKWLKANTKPDKEEQRKLNAPQEGPQEGPQEEFIEGVIEGIIEGLEEELGEKLKKELKKELREEFLEGLKEGLKDVAPDVEAESSLSNIPGRDPKTGRFTKSPARKKVEETNEGIYDFLVKSGELEAAEFVLERMSAPEQDVKNLSDIQTNTNEVQRLSVINSGILEKLSEIEENMIDEQDTSIDLPAKLQKEKEQDAIAQPEEKKEEGNWLLGLLGMLFGPWLAKLLGIGSLSGIALKLLGAGLGFIKDIVKSIFKGLFAPIQKVIDMILGVLNKIPGVGKVLSVAGKLVKGATAGVAALGAAAGLGGLFSSKANASIDTPDKLSQVDKDKANSKANNDFNNKNNKGAPKLSASKLPKHDGLAKKLLKFTKPIPLIGTAIMAGAAIYSAVDGYGRADEILGKEKSRLTESDKLAAAAGALVQDLTWPISLSATNTAKNLLSWMGLEDNNKHSNTELGIAAQEQKQREQQVEESHRRIMGGEQIAPPGAGDPSKLLTFTARTGSEENFDKLDGGLQKQVLSAAGNLDRGKIQINSGFRDPADQQRLWDESVKLGTPGRGPTGMLVGKPGTSLHEKGLAIDVQPYPAVVQAMKDAGLKQPYPDTDPVHFVKGGASVSTEKKAGGDTQVTGLPTPEVEKGPPIQVSKGDSDKSAAIAAADLSQKRNNNASRAESANAVQTTQAAPVSNINIVNSTNTPPDTKISSAFKQRQA